MRKRLLIVVLFFALLGFAGHGQASSSPARVALVIGVGSYDHGPDLPNTIGDARAMAKTFKTMGYRTLLAENLTVQEMKNLLHRLKGALNDTKQIVVFFSGHGVQFGGASYLLMRDSRMEWRDMRDTAISIDMIANAFSDRPRQKVFLIDACRDNPVYHSQFSHDHIAPFQSAGTLMAFAAQPGGTAYTGSGAHSPFVASLIRHLDEGGALAQEVLLKVRLDVIRATGAAQIPWTRSSLIRPAYFGAPD